MSPLVATLRRHLAATKNSLTMDTMADHVIAGLTNKAASGDLDAITNCFLLSDIGESLSETGISLGDNSNGGLFAEVSDEPLIMCGHPADAPK